jgi:squalene synthase HpnC
MTTAMTSDSTSSDPLLEAGWQALPAAYRMPDKVPSLEEARAYCRQLTESHFHCIYAYCRISDDLGDEVGDTQQSLALLDFWKQELDACYAGVTRHPVFVALAETISICDIPKEPFADLLVAFRQDQTVGRYQTRPDVLDYCRYSANPVGRLVLYACGYRDAERFRLSDATCTALQLANFWQDVSVDWQKDRVYIPLDDLHKFGLDESALASGCADDSFRALMSEEVAWARQLFGQGMPLLGMVDRELALDLDLFSRGGLEILRAIEKQNYDVLKMRPAISKPRKAALMLHALAAKFVPGFRIRKAV